MNISLGKKSITFKSKSNDRTSLMYILSFEKKLSKNKQKQLKITEKDNQKFCNL